MKPYFHAQNLTIQEEEGGERLVLCGGCNRILICKMREILTDFLRPHLKWMALMMKEYETLDDPQISIFRANAIMLESEKISKLGEKRRLL